MIQREYGDYFNDILNSILEMQEFVEDLSFEEFIEDKKTINAVIRSLEVLGEAAKKIPPSLKSRHANIPWKKMAGLRDKLIHEYFGVDLEIVWNVIQKDLPRLKPKMMKLQKFLK